MEIPINNPEENAKALKLLIHIFLHHSKENLLNETLNNFDFKQILRNFFTDFEETFSFLKFELRNLEIILKQPENYFILVELLSEAMKNLLISLNNTLEFESNLSIYNVKLAEIFNCALFFIYFPLLIEKKKKFRSFKNIDENKQMHTIIAFFPNYCCNCKKKLKNKEKLFPYKKEFLIIVCNDCQEVMQPYYSNDGSILDIISEVDYFLLNLCENKLKEIQFGIQEKISIFSNNETNFYLDYLFKIPQWVEILIFSNVLKDVLI